MFAINNEDSFNEVSSIYDRIYTAYDQRKDSLREFEINKNQSISLEQHENYQISTTKKILFPAVLIGNKKDVGEDRRLVELKSTLQYADSQNMQYFETGKDATEQIHTVVEELVKQIIKFRRKRLVLNVERSVSQEKKKPRKGIMFSSVADKSMADEGEDDDKFLKKFAMAQHTHNK